MSRANHQKLILVTKLIKSPSVQSFWLDVKGNSMRPLLKHGRRILFTKFNNNFKLHFGQIVAVIINQKIMVHRVIDIRKKDAGNQILTKGDSRLAADGWLGLGQVIGVMPGSRAAEILMGGGSWIIYRLNNLFQKIGFNIHGISFFKGRSAATSV